MDDPEYCDHSKEVIHDGVSCTKCWDREIPEANTTPHIKDSGERREFATGAVRDIQEGKGRCDLLPLDVVCDDDVLGAIENFKSTADTFHLRVALANCTFFPDLPTMLLEVSKHFEEGAKKYGEYNWQKGIPTHCYIDSAARHYLKHRRGDTDEPHDRAFVWNLLCCMWTCKHKPELNDYAKEAPNEKPV
jgi:hypothetical protein